MQYVAELTQVAQVPAQATHTATPLSKVAASHGQVFDANVLELLLGQVRQFVAVRLQVAQL